MALPLNFEVRGRGGSQKGVVFIFARGRPLASAGNSRFAMAYGSGCVGACVNPVSSRYSHASARASIVGLLAGVCDCLGVFYFALTGRRYIDLKENFSLFIWHSGFSVTADLPINIDFGVPGGLKSFFVTLRPPFCFRRVDRRAGQQVGERAGRRAGRRAARGADG